MVEPINLNKARKTRARAEKAQRAQENRIRFGRTKAEKARDAKRESDQKNALDDLKRDRQSD